MKVGVIGAGTMGSGIAQAFAQTEGYEVYLCDINDEFAANDTLTKYDRGVRWDSEDLEIKGLKKEFINKYLKKLYILELELKKVHVMELTEEIGRGR